jgi:hypothetical protein
VFWLPRGATWLNREKPRPFALATGCDPRSIGTLVYGSTAEAQKSMGAACVDVAPVRTGLNRNGLLARTWFYPGILLRRSYDQLPAHVGSLGAALEYLRSSLRVALGIGRGSCMRLDAPAGSRRGRIVELDPKVGSFLGTRFAIVLTEPEYSRAKNYQVIVPVIPGDDMAAGPTVHRIEQRAWFGVFPRRVRSVLLPIPAVQSLWYASAFARETEFVVDEDTLAEIDRRLCDYFSLPAPGTDRTVDE